MSPITTTPVDTAPAVLGTASAAAQTPLTAHLARPGTRSDSADSALLAAVTAQAGAAHEVVSRTAGWAATPSTGAESPAPHPSHPSAPVTVTTSPVLHDVVWPATPGVDPADWLSAQLGRFSQGDRVDPYAEIMLRRAGFAPAPR